MYTIALNTSLLFKGISLPVHEKIKKVIKTDKKLTIKSFSHSVFSLASYKAISGKFIGCLKIHLNWSSSLNMIYYICFSQANTFIEGLKEDHDWFE